MPTKRMIFIPELKAKIADGLRQQQVPDHVISRAFELWESGKPAASIWERGCFGIFQKVQADVDGE